MALKVVETPTTGIPEHDPLDFSKLNLPKPAGWMVLVAIPKPKEKTAGGIIKPDQVVLDEQLLATVGLVVGMGPDAYKNKDIFPSGPRCKVGDWVYFRSYAGTKLVHGPSGEHLRLLKDDAIEATTGNPTDYLQDTKA